MKLYNTLTKKVEQFTPLKDAEIRLYSCGPTVYDHIHIGNLAGFIYADSLRRALKASFPAAKIKHVMNITDVDDKTIKRSQEKYPNLDPKEALAKLTAEYEQLFKQDMLAVGNDIEALTFVKATDSIPAMQELIARLHKNGFAYRSDDGVYFSIEAYKQSGKKYGQLTPINSQNTSQNRIQNDEYDKESAHDFALWKLQKGNEPAWDFELEGQNLKGRPGWHIECSAMSQTTLGQPFDIHTGGVDLIFPHHENEIAQSTAGQDDPLLAKLFFHNEHLLVEGKKMSKSLNNFFTLEDIKRKSFDPLAFRLMVLQSNYRHQSNFTWESLTATQSRLVRFRNLAARRYQIPHKVDGGTFDTKLFDKQLFEITPALEDDLGTPAALKAIEDYIDNHLFDDHKDEYWILDQFIASIDATLGLQLSKTADLAVELIKLIKQREQARQEKDFKQADELRQQLEEQGVGVRDTEQGPIWYRL